MSLTSECLKVLIRSLPIAWAAVMAAFFLKELLRIGGRKTRITSWIIILMPAFAPALVIGYSYWTFFSALMRYPFYNELLYSTLVLLHFTPLALLVLYFAPAAVSREAVFCFRMTNAGKPFLPRTVSETAFFLKTSGKPFVAAFSLVFLFAFTEFEMASLLSIGHWTVVLFDNQVQGFPVLDSLKMTILPVLAECVFMFILLFTLKKSGKAVLSRAGAGKKRWFLIIPGFLYGVTAFSAIVLVPLFVLLKGTLSGISLLFESFHMHKEITASFIIAFSVSICIYSISLFFVRVIPYIRNGKAYYLLLVLLLPALAGALPVALALLALFQLPGLNALRDTPVPQLIGLCFLLFPIAFVLQMLFRSISAHTSVHSARLLSSSKTNSKEAAKILWKLSFNRQIWIFFLVFVGAFFDLTVSSVLEPTGMTTILVRLYNLMHYGQSEKLTAILFLTLAVPIIFFIVINILCPFVLRSFSSRKVT